MAVTTPASRADRVNDALREHEVDALIVSAPANVRYLTGYTGSNGLAVLGPGLRRFITDFRYVSQAAEEVGDTFDREQAEQELATALKQGWPDGVARVGFEEDHLTVRAHQRLREHVPDRIELIGVSGAVEQVRRVKEPEEVDRIRAAAAIADEIYAWLLDSGVVGRTEREVAVALEHQMRLFGAEGPSFDSIVASAEHSALPHARPRDVEIARDTLITFDLGCRLDGYCSDCTRTFATGPLPDDLAAIYDLVARAQAAALDAVRPGPTGREVDAIARAIIDDAGHRDHFGHGLGHGVGIEVHEGPRLSRTSETALAPGNVVTVEPGVYIPGRGGVRIEDLVLVTDTGHDVISGFSKDLLRIG